MENYSIDINYINENSNNEKYIDNYFILLNIKYNNFNIYTLEIDFIDFYDKFIKKYNKEIFEEKYILENVNGGCNIHKNDTYLTFNVSKYGNDCSIDSSFTIKINEEVDKMIDNIKNFYLEKNN